MPDTQIPTTEQAVVTLRGKSNKPTPLRDLFSGRSRSLSLRYGSAVFGTAVATLLRMALQPLLAERVPFVTYFVAVVFSAWIGGMGPGLLSVALGTIAAWYLIVPPPLSFALSKTPDMPAILVFVCMGTVLSAMGESQRRAQQALHASKEWLSTTLQSLGDAVIATDTKGRITFMNPIAETLTGWTQEEASGAPLERVFVIRNEQTRRQVETPVEKVLKSGAIQGLANHTILIARDGTERPIDDSAAPIRSGERLLGVVMIFRDFTAHRQAEAEIAMLNARLHRAVYESSHRIKNHLQILATTLDMALMGGREQISADVLRRLGTQIRTLSALQDILTLEWKADRSGSIETLSSKALLEKTLDILRQAPGGERLSYQVEAVTLPVKQATSLALITNEAVTNALKHGKRSVEVRFRLESGMGRLDVSDDGPGFPADFDPNAAARTGLELISSLAVFDLGGTARFENLPAGGARVSLSFPLPEQETAYR